MLFCASCNDITHNICHYLAFFNNLWQLVSTKNSNIHRPLCTFEIQAQSLYREVPRWEIFVEQELRFGLDLGPLAVLKKIGSRPIMSNF